MSNLFNMLNDNDDGDSVLGFETVPEVVRLVDNTLPPTLKLSTVILELKRRGIKPRGSPSQMRKKLAKLLAEETESLQPVLKGWNIDARYVACIDFEATCDDKTSFLEFPHEIIEFPAVVIDIETNSIVDEFHSYIKPKINPILSDYCKKLTGITQEQVDSSPDFSTVLNNFLSWLQRFRPCSQGIICESSTLETPITPSDSSSILSSDSPFICGSTCRYIQSPFIVFSTHGPSDLKRFLVKSCDQNEISVPDLFKHKFIDMQKNASYILKRCKKNCKPYSDSWAPNGKNSLSLVGIVDSFRLEFTGRNHSGLDDSRMVAKILMHWADINCSIKVNSQI